MAELLVKPMVATIPASIGVTNPNNLLNERLGRAGIFLTGSDRIDVDLGSPQLIDTVALLATDAGADVTWRLFGSNSPSFTTTPLSIGLEPFASSDALKRVHRQGLRTFTPISVQYLRIFVNTPVDMAAGRLVVGKRFEPIEQRDYEWDYRVVDLGENRRSANGIDDPTIRGKVMEYSWNWSGLTKAEARGTLLDLLAYAGNTRDLLVCLDDAADDKHNLIGYGKLPDPVVVPNIAEDWYEAKFTLQSRLVLSL